MRLRHPVCRLRADGVLVPGPELAAIDAESDLFNGFDEIWCFDDEPKCLCPEDVRIAGGLGLDRDAIPSEVVAYMRSLGCRLGLGDGLGVNYVTPDSAMADRLIATLGL